MATFRNDLETMSSAGCAAAMGTNSIFVLSNALRLEPFHPPMLERRPGPHPAEPDLRPATA